MQENDNAIVVNQTPIEVLLQVDSDGMASAKNVYTFLEMNQDNYARWYKTNILENEFAEEGTDYQASVIKDGSNGRMIYEFKLSTVFAKKLCMKAGGVRGEQARNYFAMVEGKMKEIAARITTLQPPYSETKAVSLGEVANVLKIMVSTMKGQSLNPHIVAKQVEITCSQFGIKTILEFVSKSPYERLRLPEAALIGGEA
jgi:phage anti-repressor protein